LSNVALTDRKIAENITLFFDGENNNNNNNLTCKAPVCAKKNFSGAGGQN